MDGGADEIAWTLVLECAPAAMFGLAVAFSASQLPIAAIASVAWVSVGFGAFLAGWIALRRFAASGAQYHFPHFDASLLEPEFEELTEPAGDSAAGARKVGLVSPCKVQRNTGELLLDDVLSHVEPDSRVVRLFRPGVPTPGQLHAQIDRQLCSGRRAVAPDASEALHEALAALRQSLG